MMKVVLYEWKKLWKNASVLKIVLFFVSISSIVFWSELSKDKEWVPKYLELHESVDDMKTEDMMGWLKAELEKQSKIENESENYVTYKALSCLQTEIEAFVNYDNYRETIQNRYKDNQSISVFSDSDVGHNKYMEQIARKYKHLHIKASMRLQPYQGVQGILDYYAGDILLIVFLIYLVSVVFIQEQKTGKLSFAHTMDLGGGHLFTAKVILVYGSMILYLFLTFSINFLLMYFMYGSISLSVAVQSVPELFAVPYAWTIGQYLLSYIALKAVAIFLLTAIAILTARWFVSEVAVSAVLAGIIGVSIWAGNVLIGDDIQSIFRFWNLWSVLRGKTFIGNYELIRFDNNFIEVIWGIPVFVITAVVLYLFTGMHKWRERNKRFKERKLKDKKPHTIFYYEMKKMWIYQGGLVFFIVCILIQGMCVNEYRQSLTTCDFYYYQYIDKFGNQITTQTDEKIRLEEQRLQKLEEELMTETNFVKVSKIQQELEWMEGLGKYKYRVEDLKTAKKQEILLKDTQYDLLFNYTDVSRMMVILLCVSFAFFIPAVFKRKRNKNGNFAADKSAWRKKIVEC